MAISTSIKIKDNKANVYTTSYEPIKNPGGKPLDYASLGTEALARKRYKKVNRINENQKTFNDYINNNQFDYYITLSSIDPQTKIDILKAIKKDDNGSEFVSVATWTYDTYTGDLHYHILLKTILSQEEVEKHLTKCNSDVQAIYNQQRLAGYFRKNFNDTIYVLKQTEKTTLNVDYADLREKQLEILNCKYILTNSKNLNKTEEIVIKNATDADIAELEKNYDNTSSYSFLNYGSEVKVDQYTKKEEDTTPTATKAVKVGTKASLITAMIGKTIETTATKDAKVGKNTSIARTTGKIPVGSHSFVGMSLSNQSQGQQQDVDTLLKALIKKVSEDRDNNREKAENSHTINIDNIFKHKELNLCLQKESLINQQHLN